jgi:hypothetical protein
LGASFVVPCVPPCEGSFDAARGWADAIYPRKKRASTTWTISSFVEPAISTRDGPDSSEASTGAWWIRLPAGISK